MECKEAKASAELSGDVEGSPGVAIELGEWSAAPGWREQAWCIMSPSRARALAMDLMEAARRVEAVCSWDGGP